MKKVLVMGGTYFIGKKIVDVLVGMNYDVSVLNRGSKRIWNEKIRQIICDRNNEDEMRAALLNLSFDVIIDVCGVNKMQVEILYKTIDISRLSHFVFISSSAVYCVDHLTIPFAETDMLGENIWGDYGTNKIESEEYLRTVFENSNVKLIMLRPPYVYGENNYAQRESFIFEHICKDKPILIPNTNPKLQFIYTTDLANIIVTLLNRTMDSSVSIYNVGNIKPVTAKEWVFACGEAVGKTPKIIVYDYKRDDRFVRDFFPFFDYDNILDVSKIKSIYPNETAFSFGLQETYKWYLAEQDTLRFKENIAKNEDQILEKLRHTK